MKILLIDDHPLFREGMRHLLARLADAVMVHEAADLRAGLQLCRAEGQFDLALLDLNMPGMAGIDAVATFRDSFPAIPLVVLSAAQGGAEIRQALAAGAAGFIPKSSTSEVMLGAIRLVLSGGTYLPPQALDGRRLPARAPAGAEATPAAGSGRVSLSERQLEVLALLVQGKPNKVIARELDVSEGTVKMHLAIIFGTLQARNRTEAVAAAQRLGLLTL